MSVMSGRGVVFIVFSLTLSRNQQEVLLVLRVSKDDNSKVFGEIRYDYVDDDT